ncbi:hypothetical protein Mpe_B0552 (plasmid) [Methylibium petroleiphilum PM1]|uniref:Uncharacterized protein n=2 Tax=Sphaerotilaceae TaxID=2975441 RepID=A2SP33_METPP|nr:hypothetical protein Mpe_B0552 [Methylibium petroleiphilum PM1]AEX20408.1 hypothetical protein [Aquincola tertiaricarbonis]
MGRERAAPACLMRWPSPSRRKWRLSNSAGSLVKAPPRHGVLAGCRLRRRQGACRALGDMGLVPLTLRPAEQQALQEAAERIAARIAELPAAR